jgi:hypothetical protein
MRQSHLQLHPQDFYRRSPNPDFSQRVERSVAVDRPDVSEVAIAQLKETLCTDLSPNKRAIVDQLIKLWSQNDLG